MSYKSSYLRQNQSALGSRHYIINATAENHWYGFYKSRVDEFRKKHGENFCLIINGSHVQDDAYVIPFKSFKEFFTDDYLDTIRNRWVGTIQDNKIKLTANSRPTKVFSAGEFYNAFHFLSDVEPVSETTSLIVTEQAGLIGPDLLKLIYDFNEKYKNTAPERQLVVSERIARPNAITDYVKQLQDYTCQICGGEGFCQRNGFLYIEAHHIIELHELIPGSYCSDNIVVVCPTCHRMLHYANVSYESRGEETVVVMINADKRSFQRNVISQKNKASKK